MSRADSIDFDSHRAAAQDENVRDLLAAGETLENALARAGVSYDTYMQRIRRASPTDRPADAGWTVNEVTRVVHASWCASVVACDYASPWTPDVRVTRDKAHRSCLPEGLPQ